MDQVLQAAAEVAAARWGEVTRKQAAQLLRLARSLAEVGASGLLTGAIAYIHGDEELKEDVVALVAQHMRERAAEAYHPHSGAYRRLLLAITRAIDRRGYRRLAEALAPWRDHSDGDRGE